MPSYDWILGLDIGGTKTAAVLGDKLGVIHKKAEIATEALRGFDSVFASICNVAQEVLEDAKNDRPPAQCVSVSIGGPLDIDKGIVLSPPNLPGWNRIPLKSMLNKRFGLPVYIEHDGNAGALAEWLFGGAIGANNIVFLTMGTGIGGGLILNGRLYRGSSYLAGEVGHIRLAENGPLAYGKEGSWESFCSGAGISRLAALRFPKRWGNSEITIKQLATLAENEDEDSKAVFNEAGEYLGKGLSILIDLLNPELIVLGSLGVRLGDRLLIPAQRVIEKETLPGALKACRIIPSQLGEELGDKAALCAALQSGR